MTRFRLICASSALLLFACPSGDRCNSVTCPTGQTCDSNDGTCHGSDGGTGGGGGSGGGSTGGGQGGGNLTPIALTDACSQVAKAYVDRFVRCKQMEAADSAAVTAVIAENCSWPSQVNAGFVHYNGTAAAQCVHDLGTDPCVDTNNDLAPSCGAIVIPGFGEAGQPCTDFTSCDADAGLYCPFENGCTTCQHGKRLGEACSFAPDVECQPDLACNDPNQDGGTCAQVNVLGGLCGFDFNTFGFTCNPGLRCNETPLDGGSPDCEPAIENGLACTGDTDCATTSYCPTASSKCTTRIPDGMPCDNTTVADPGAECAGGWCTRDLGAIQQFSPDVADAGGPSLCGFLMQNDVCYLDQDCGPGNHCKGYRYKLADAGTVAGQCAPLDPDGGMCTNSATRGADSCANPLATCLDGLCVVTPEFSRMVNQTCDFFNQCGEGTRCNREDPVTYEGHCVPVSDDNGPCFQDNECKLGDWCVGGDPNSGTLGTCSPLSLMGQACDPSVSQTGGCQLALNCMMDPDGGTGLCQPYVGLGTPCDVNYGPVCYGSFCSADAGSCISRQGAGAMCDSSTQCTSSQCSNPDGGLDGETCQMACF